MVQLLNERKIYNFNVEDGTLKISGSITYVDGNSISDMYGNATENGMSIGSFNYSEDPEGHITKSLMNVTSDKLDQLSTKIDTIVSDIKEQLTV